MIIGYLGSRGRGKTLSCVREAYEHQKNGYTIYSNIHLDQDTFPGYKKISKKMLMDWVSSETQFSKAFFLLDEIHVFMDSRMGMSKKNVVISYFLAQTRKRDVRIGYTTQFWNQADKRLRQLTEVVVYCWYDHSCDEAYNVIEDQESMKRIKISYDAQKWFDTYDTSEIVNPFKDD